MSQYTDPINQSVAEWLDEYGAHEPDISTPPNSAAAQSSNACQQNIFRYVDHRTVNVDGRTSVVMEFQSIDYKFTAVRFFNVSLKGARGKNYPAGRRGQFNPPEKGKFRLFWMQAIGRPPSRWSRVHKTMRATLGPLIFTGKTVQDTDRNGRKFNKLIEIYLHE